MPLTAASSPSAGDGHAVRPLRHSVADDVLGLATGTFIASLGMFLLTSGGVVTGGTAGLSLLLNYALAWPFALLFAAVNLPFFGLAIRRRGWNFSARTLLCILLVSGLSAVHAAVWEEVHLPPLYAALAGNALCGVGLLILFRHGASLGGFNIIALIAQDALGWRAGWVLLVLDAGVVLASLGVASPSTVAISALGALLLSTILALNHRPGRYSAG